MALKIAICLLLVNLALAKQLNFDEDFFPSLTDRADSNEDAEAPSWFQELANQPSAFEPEEVKKPPVEQPAPEPVHEEAPVPQQSPEKIPEKPKNPFLPSNDDNQKKPVQKPDDDYYKKPVQKPDDDFFVRPAQKLDDDYLKKPPQKPQNNYNWNNDDYYQRPAEKPQNNYYGQDNYENSWYNPPSPPKRPQQNRPQKQNERGTLKRAEPCNLSKCQAPKCRCSDVYLSRDIDEKDIPQMVVVSFDDAVTALNYNYIKESMGGLRNPDGCPIQATFFVSHEYTDYTKVHMLWSQGHEIALHSISHSPYTKYWRNADVETLVREFGGQRQMMAHFANMDIKDIQGLRVPLFEISGNNTYQAMKQIGLTYDSSWPTQHFVSPGLWPYSLDYLSAQDCPIGTCPTASIPNVWVNPILMWEDVEGSRCSMIDACPYPPEDDVNAIFHFMVRNFNNTYHSNRAPFGIYMHASWFLKGDHHFEAFKRFLKYLNQNQDVYIVSSSRILEFVRSPKIGKPFDSCQTIREPACKERFCRLMKTDTKTERWMKSCMPCPAVYPWLGNPFGKAQRQQNDH